MIYHNGLMVFEAADRENKCIKGADGQKHAVLELLEQNTYAKVYVMFGVNELGYGDDQAFYDTYGQFLDQIRQLQPDAVLYLQAIIPVNEEVAKKYDGRAYVTNAKITEYNTLLRQLAEEKQVVYLDLASALAGRTARFPPRAPPTGSTSARSGIKSGTPTCAPTPWTRRPILRACRTRHPERSCLP